MKRLHLGALSCAGKGDLVGIVHWAVVGVVVIDIAKREVRVHVWEKKSFWIAKSFAKRVFKPSTSSVSEKRETERLALLNMLVELLVFCRFDGDAFP